MIRIAICEDEQTLSARLSGWVSSILDRHSIAYSIETYQNGSALLAREPYDIRTHSTRLTHTMYTRFII